MPSSGHYAGTRAGSARVTNHGSARGTNRGSARGTSDGSAPVTTAAHPSPTTGRKGSGGLAGHQHQRHAGQLADRQVTLGGHDRAQAGVDDGGRPVEVAAGGTLA